MNWDEIFATARLSSGPVTDGLTVSKVRVGGYSVWDGNEKQIMESAAKHGYFVCLDNERVISFIRKRVTA